MAWFGSGLNHCAGYTRIHGLVWRSSGIRRIMITQYHPIACSNRKCNYSQPRINVLHCDEFPCSSIRLSPIKDASAESRRLGGYSSVFSLSLLLPRILSQSHPCCLLSCLHRLYPVSGSSDSSPVNRTASTLDASSQYHKSPIPSPASAARQSSTSFRLPSPALQLQVAGARIHGLKSKYISDLSSSAQQDPKSIILRPYLAFDPLSSDSTISACLSRSPLRATKPTSLGPPDPLHLPTRSPPRHILAAGWPILIFATVLVGKTSPFPLPVGK